METNKKFSLRDRARSFRFAANGLRILLRNEHNARIHILAALLSLAAGILLGLSSGDMLLIVFAIGLVFVTELLNTAVEYVCDWLSPEYNEKVKAIKDLCAAAVLVSALVAAVIGAVLFGTRIYQLLS